MIFVSKKVVQKLFKVVGEPWKPSESIDNIVVRELSKSSQFTHVVEEHRKSSGILIFDIAASDNQLGTSIYSYMSLFRRQGRHQSREIWTFFVDFNPNLGEWNFSPRNGKSCNPDILQHLVTFY